MSVAIVDYGLGNLLSVHRALAHLGVDVVTSGDPEVIARGSRVILPGVGAFREGMRNLCDANLDEALRRVRDRGDPVLGICLGMQLLFEESSEFGAHRGLGFLPGEVALIPTSDELGERRVPLVGWLPLRPGPADSPLLPPRAGLEDHWMYFVHSYRCVAEENDVAAVVEHGGLSVCAAVRHDNVHGCQFHPEKSGPLGLRIIQRFVEL